METTFALPADRARTRRRRMQLLQVLLRALAQPLWLMRQAHRRAKDLAASETVHRSLDSLLHELSAAAHTVTRRLSAGGWRDARRVAWKHASAHGRSRASTATQWARDLVGACQGCAVRLCALFRAATELADRTSTRLAYGLLRTLERELWFLDSNILSSNHGHAHRA